MKMFQYSVFMLKKEKKKALFYVMNCTFSVMMTFFFVNLIYNDYLYGQFDINRYGQANKIFSVMLCFLTVAFIIGMSFFAYNFYLISQTKELGIFMLAGTKLTRIFSYLFYQNLAIYGFALVLGLILGALVIPLANLYICHVTGMQMPIFNYSKVAFFGTIGLISTVLIYLAIVATGFIHRNEIKELLGMKKEMKKKDQRLLEIPKFVYIVLFLFPIPLFFVGNDPTITAFYSALAVIAGFNGFCRYVMPTWINRLQRKVLITHRIGLISSANFHQLLVQTCTTIRIFLIICIFMNIYMLVNVQNKLNLSLITLSYVALVISVAMGLAYKILLETHNRQITFAHLHKLGYTKKELSQMIKQEMIALFGMVLGILVLYVGAIYLPYVLEGQVSFGMMIQNMGIFILTLILVGIYGYSTYLKAMMKGME